MPLISGSRSDFDTGELDAYDTETLEEILKVTDDILKERKRKYELRQPQIRVLKVLAEAPGPLPVHRIAKKADIHFVWVERSLGYRDPIRDAKWESEYGHILLYSRGYADWKCVEVDGKQVHMWFITDLGRSAWEERYHAVEIKPKRVTRAAGDGAKRKKSRGE